MHVLLGLSTHLFELEHNNYCPIFPYHGKGFVSGPNCHKCNINVSDQGSLHIL